MKRRDSPAALPLEAALSWTRLGHQWLEMMAASGEVIAHRTSRRNTPWQWAAMGTEKWIAGVASSSAMARHMTALPVHDAVALQAAWARLLLAGMAPYRTRAVRNAKALRRR